MIEQAEIHWHLTDKCNHGCFYCPSKYSGGKNNHTIEKYVEIIEKLQTSKYQHAKSIKWKLGGGEPLQFGGINVILKLIKSKPSFVRLDTSGGETWFETLEIRDFVDHLLVTHHYWQNPSVLNFIIDFCQENNKLLDIMVPLQPGKIRECKALVKDIQSKNVNCHEQTLYDDQGKMIMEYSKGDLNLIKGLPEDYEEPIVNQPPPYVDLSKPPVDDTPSYTGKPCYAGVDYMFISSKGYISGSECGGRNLGNIYSDDWIPPMDPFNCVMTYCRSSNDREKIRIIK